MLFWLIWFACGLYTYPVTLHYFQSKYPTVRMGEDAGVAALLALIGGPAATFIVTVLALTGGYYGFQWKPKKPVKYEL